MTEISLSGAARKMSGASSAYLNAIRKQVHAKWSPTQADAFQRPDPAEWFAWLYGRKDRPTILRVSLTAQGALDDAQIVGPSGVEFLDEVALKAFREAAPFPPAPSELVTDGRVAFRFGFLFEPSRAQFSNRQPRSPGDAAQPVG